MFDGDHHRFPSSRIIPQLIIQTPPPATATAPEPAISTSTNLNSYLSFDHPLLFHHQTLFQSNHDHQYIINNNDTQGQGKEIDESWSHDEVIQLLRIKSSSSSSENWFKDFTNWDHVSRKLAEMGYKRSSQKCKQKFEEETCTSFTNNTIGIGYNKNSSSRYLITEEFDEHLSDHVMTIESPDLVNDHQHNLEAPAAGQKGDHFPIDDEVIIMAQLPTDHQDEDGIHELVAKSKTKRKRKHDKKKFKMVKGLCADLVKKMMAQQEEMHKQLLEDMAKRDEEKTKREEAWRKEEMEIHMMREHEQEMARDRQFTITQYLNNLTSNFDKKIQIPPFDNMNLQDLDKIIMSSLSAITKIPSSSDEDDQLILVESKEDKDTGKRWPRDEVLALINIRNYNVNNMMSTSDQHQHQHHGGRGSLWERISQGMMEMGYKRNAKRCKEKWENINKYFRKTNNKKLKRSLESRTCPYYHELTKLYNSTQEELLATPRRKTDEDGPVNSFIDHTLQVD